MLLPEALTLVNRLIETGEKHQDYERTTELAETYRIYITGCDIGKKLIQFVQREDAALFAQRLRLTKSITPAVASSIRQPFGKVTRNDRIKKGVKIKNQAREQAVNAMIKGFYGSTRKKSRGLDYWMKTRFVEMQFIDPNSWVVVEWEAPENEGQVIKPRPFEVDAKQAVNFFIVNDEVRWLFVEQAIRYMSLPNNVATASAGTAPGYIGGTLPVADPSKPVKKDGYRYTLYDQDVTVLYEQVDPEYLKASGYVLKEGETLVKIKDIHYLTRSFQPNVGYAPVFRIGYKRDEATKGRTFVNPWHDALCFFDKSLKTVSELDLTQTLHVFPQKLQYVQKCTGPSQQKRCKNGLLQDGTTCPACNGTSYKVHTTAQDIILLPMPDGPQDMLDLEKLIAYKYPPIELIKFQNEYTQQLERQAHQAVFNSQVFVKKQATSDSAGQGFQTATESDNNMESVYDALDPFTEQYSALWRDFVTTFGILSGEPIEGIDVMHDFPEDLKLKTKSILMGERKAATDSGAPAFLIVSIDDDLATTVYAGDPLGLQKYTVKRRFYPFLGNTPDEIVELLTSKFVLEEPKILYSNFDAIFREIELDNPEFWAMTDLKKQRDLVGAKVEEYKKRLKDQQPTVTMDSFRNGNPAGGEGAGGDGNPGDDGDGENNNEDGSA